MQNKKLKFTSFWLPLFIFAVAVICFYKVVDKLPNVFEGIGTFISILTPFILGVAIAFVLFKPMTLMEKGFKKSKFAFFKKHSRGISVLISYILFFTVIAALLYLILPKIFASIMSLVNNIPTYYKMVVEYLKDLAGSDGKILGYEIALLTGENFDISGILSMFKFDDIMQYAGEVFKATGAIVDTVMAFVVSVYLLLGYEHLIKVCGNLARLIIPKERVISLYRFMGRTCDIFYNYIYSQLLDALVVAVLCFIIFAIIGIPYALLLAVVMGICNLVPYFGAIIGGAGVAFVTLISTGDLIKALIALACIIGAQQLDANVIQPKIVANSLGLKPIYVLLAILVGGGLFGFLGILLSVPIVAVIRMLLLDYMAKVGDKGTSLVRRQEKIMAVKKTNRPE